MLALLARAPGGGFSAGPAQAEAVVNAPLPTADPLEEEARRVGERFGVTVLVNEDAAISLPPYRAEPCLDRSKAFSALHEAEAAMALYPEGFFRALGGTPKLAFCGRIAAAGRGALDSVSALTGSIDGSAVMLIDANSSGIALSLMHETVHAADMRIDEAAEAGSPYWGDEAWSLLDPPGFVSGGAYTLPDGRPYAETASVRYTAESDCDPEDVWFVNRYSKTFPTEDRAVLFETLMRVGPDSVLFLSPHLTAKLRFMFAAARRYLDPGGTWEEPTFWERKLNEATGNTKGAACWLPLLL